MDTGAATLAPKPATNRPDAVTSESSNKNVASASAPTAPSNPSRAQAALQQQIQQQLQAQLQAQIQAAAAKGQQANITKAQIEAQAEAMVQAAAQAHAVVAAAKARDGLHAMNSTQIAALSQIQAQAIVNARPSTALIAAGIKADENHKPTPAQIQAQIQLQTQALIHAHTQALIAAGLYKGEGPSAPVKASSATAPQSKKAKIHHSSSLASSNNTLASLTPSQVRQQNELTSRQSSLRNELLKSQRAQVAELRTSFQKNNLVATPSSDALEEQMKQMQELQKKHASEQREQQLKFQKEMQDLQSVFRRQNAAAKYAGIVQQQPLVPNPVLKENSNSLTSTSHAGAPPPLLPNPSKSMHTGQSLIQSSSNHASASLNSTSITSSDSPSFKNTLAQSLHSFWSGQMTSMIALPIGTETDFKNHNDLPLARIKRIMKSDEDVRMISAEAPVLFAKACEMFILELTLRSWAYSESHKRRTLQKEDIQMAIQRTDIFDFLVDVIH